MAALSAILRSVEGGGLSFRCPGCGDTHMVPVGDGAGPRWSWNGDIQRPTFSPSILVRSGHHVPGHDGLGCWCTWDDRAEFPDLKCTICHSFVTGGMIQFLGDCTHALAGQTVELPAWAGASP